MTPFDALRRREVVPLELEIEFSGIPDGATLKAELVGIKLPVAAAVPVGNEVMTIADMVTSTPR